jgi:spore maturation protein CgeB
MRIVYFTHSLRSCWNHGNAHFLRGVLSDLVARGHDAVACEPADAWSLVNLVNDHGHGAIASFERAYPELRTTEYESGTDVAELVADADLVIAHEWNEPELVAALGRARARGDGFVLLFHDTHHRAVSAPHEMRGYDLDGYDGVLAFGATLARVYEGWGWGNRVFVWHEAADTRRFFPLATPRQRQGLVWIGNWGDGERSDELVRFLLQPAEQTGLPLDIYGVRYADEAKRTLARFGARYHGWLANSEAPGVFAGHLGTVHVPRRFYAQVLPGIPTIRVFEALACGIPLASAPWDDCEGLFRVGKDFVMARDAGEMTALLRDLKHDAGLRESLVRSGLETIRARHTCAHRVDELLGIVAQLSQPALESAA